MVDYLICPNCGRKFRFKECSECEAYKNTEIPCHCKECFEKEFGDTLITCTEEEIING